jgi:hypothetical protein
VPRPVVTATMPVWRWTNFDATSVSGMAGMREQPLGLEVIGAGGCSADHHGTDRPPHPVDFGPHQ